MPVFHQILSHKHNLSRSPKLKKINFNRRERRANSLFYLRDITPKALSTFIYRDCESITVARRILSLHAQHVNNI